jgi:hypothetical protein
MRNSTFLSLVGVVVLVGLAVGWNVDHLLSGKVSPASDEAPPGHLYLIDTTKDHGPDDPYRGYADSMRFRSRDRCTMPPATPDTQVVAFGVYESQAMSSVSVGGMDHETGIIDVEIEPGDRPLYLILSSYDPMIWRFSGATQRVSRVALSTTARTSAGTPMAGVMGLDKDRLGAVQGKGCFGSFSTAGEGRQVRAMSYAILGREPEVLGGAYDVTAVRLPSGRAAKAMGAPPRPDGFDLNQWRDAVRYSPGGLITVDPAQVIALGEAKPYGILPNQMGLSQLIGAGAMREHDGYFEITRSIAHYPAELTGAHSVVFKMAEGVSRPSGDPGHSCVIGDSPSRPRRGMDC